MLSSESPRSLPQIQHFGLEYDTVEKRKKDLGDALDNLYRFLNLVAFISLLLGAVGVASAIQAHLQQKTATGAILRCLGASARTTVFIYLLQAAAMGLVGAIAGADWVSSCNASLPRVLQSFVPFAIPDTISWQPIVRGMSDRLRHLHPLRAPIAAAVSANLAAPGLARVGELDRRARRDPVLWFIYALIAIGVTAFAISQSETWKRGVLFAGALGLAIGIFAGVAKLLMIGVRKLFPASREFCSATGTGESVSARQPHAAAHALVRPGNVSAAQSLSHAAKCCCRSSAPSTATISRTFSSSIFSRIKKRR